MSAWGTFLTLVTVAEVAVACGSGSVPTHPIETTKTPASVETPVEKQPVNWARLGYTRIDASTLTPEFHNIFFELPGLPAKKLKFGFIFTGIGVTYANGVPVKRYDATPIDSEIIYPDGTKAILRRVVYIPDEPGVDALSTEVWEILLPRGSSSS